jgi:triosephosphate isomerase
VSTRKTIVGGNWKMNLHGAEVDALTDALVKAVTTDAVEVVICPAFPYLERVGKKVAGSKVQLGAQDVYFTGNGAFTGEVSCSMLKDLGVKWVLTGHSERRHVIGETDELINRKTRAALAAGLNVILCVGEKLEQREAGQTDFVNIGQTYLGLAGVTAEQMKNVVIAYEPVWAIGTGRTATPEQAQQVHAVLRAQIAAATAHPERVRILYGGSMNASNAASLLAQPDIDGGLIGGASLKAPDFLQIVAAAH